MRRWVPPREHPRDAGNRCRTLWVQRGGNSMEVSTGRGVSSGAPGRTTTHDPTGSVGRGIEDTMNTTSHSGSRGSGHARWSPPGSAGRRPSAPGPGKGRTRPHRPRKPSAPHGTGHGGGPGGEILFLAWTVDGTEPTSQEDIFAIDTASGVVRRITDQASGVPFISDRDPAWSPDHTRIVFMSADETVPMHLRVFTSAGVPVTDLPVEGSAPAWLDDSTVVVPVGRLNAEGFYDRSDLVAVRVSDGSVTPLSALSPGEHLGEPDWNAFSGLVAILTRLDVATGEELDTRLVRATAAAVTAVRAGGAPLTAPDLTELAPGHLWPAGPAWSPNGAQLAFSAVRPCATIQSDGRAVLQMDLALLTLRTRAVEWLTDDTKGDYEAGLNDGSPTFSPDGSWLAWCRGHEDDWTRIMLRRLGHGRKATVLLDGTHWFRWGLDW